MDDNRDLENELETDLTRDSPLWSEILRKRQKEEDQMNSSVAEESAANEPAEVSCIC